MARRRARRRSTAQTATRAKASRASNASKPSAGKMPCMGCNKTFFGILLLLVAGLLYLNFNWMWIFAILGVILLIKGLWMHSRCNGMCGY